MNILEKLCKRYLERHSKYDSEINPWISTNGYKVVTEYEYVEYIKNKTKYSNKIGKYFSIRFIDDKGRSI